MTTDLSQQLQRTLGAAYVIERELGGGGMSRVFLARETAFDRRVVIKVLPPELSASVSIERFRREIQLAAGLQHPHIVPVLTAGISDGLPYFTMPFVEGEALRARLAREHELTVGDTVSILRDVGKALAYAHARGVVHRDIKPDNVLLSGGSAVVTDFGVAKALSASTEPGSSGLTSLGIAMGTPAYMAPEQAAADPDTDHRADIYALGAMAYEMLTGRPLFPGRSPQQVLAAHTMQTPESVARLRPSLPPGLAALVMRCLEKHPADRPRTADELLQSLDALATPSGGTAPAMSVATRAFLAPKGRVQFGRALAAYAAASVAVVAFAALLVQGFGVPDWVFPGAAIVMAMGLPMVLVTGFVQRAGAVAGAHRIFTWRRTAVGGVVALGMFVALVAGWSVMRVLGIGPAGSLVAAGVLRDREPILVADFGSPPGDTVLGTVVTSAFRTDLGQSRVVSVVQPARVSAALRRMQRPPGSRLDLTLAREVAMRDGVKAVLAGDVTAIGTSFVLSVRLISADSGQELAAFRASAEDAKGIIPAVDKLSKQLRAKIGESLKAVRTSRPLEQVTTGSLSALAKYSQAERAINVDGDYIRGLELLQEAIALDTSFAMAYRKLGVVLLNTQGPPEQRAAALEKAFAHSDRLPDEERYLTIGTYYTSGAARDPAKALAAYEALLELQPDNYAALNNASLMLRMQGELAKSVEYARRAVAADSANSLAYVNLVSALYETGQTQEAGRVIAKLAARAPGNPTVQELQASIWVADGQYDTAIAFVSQVRATRKGDPTTQSQAEALLEGIARARGKLTEATRHVDSGTEFDRQRGFANALLAREMTLAYYDAWYRGLGPRAVQRLDAALERWPLRKLPALERPYINLAYIYALAGRPDRARGVLADQERELAPDVVAAERFDRHNALGEIALAEGKPDRALTEFRQSDEGGCFICPLPAIGRAFALAGKPDSAIVAWEKYLDTPTLLHGNLDPSYRAGIYMRLGELYQQRGDTSRATSNYARFVAAWKDADLDLQPKVEDARRRLSALKRRESGR